MRVKDFMAFVEKRHGIYLMREAGFPRENWTDDPILQQYRFCNVYRELDTVTQWIATNWREPHADDPDLWFAFVVARHHNTIPFLEYLGGPPLDWNPERFRRLAKAFRDSGGNTFSPAYMIRSDPGDKIDYVVDAVYTPLWNAREKLRPQPGDSLTGFHMALGVFYGLASFLSAQVVADVKYTEPLLSAKDWHTFAASGPGSRRGLNRIYDQSPNAPWQEDKWRLRLTALREEILPFFAQHGWEQPHAQDVQNMLCEFDKYERVRLGEGKPKQIFRSLA